jgi:hypothetical protein
MALINNATKWHTRWFATSPTRIQRGVGCEPIKFGSTISKSVIGLYYFLADLGEV